MHGLFINFVHFIIQICGQILHYYFTFKCISFTQFSPTVVLQNLTHQPILQRCTVKFKIQVNNTYIFRLQTARDATHAGSGKHQTLVGAGTVVTATAMECQPRYPMVMDMDMCMDTVAGAVDNTTMDIIMAGEVTNMLTTHSRELTKDSSTSDEDHPEPKT